MLAAVMMLSVLPANTASAATYRWPTIPQVSAQTAILMDQATGTILYEKDAQRKMYPASLTKMLTALIVLENCSLSEEVTFSHEAVFNTYGSSAGIREGEVLTVEQCLYVLLLVSANEVGYALAEHVAGEGNIQGFADMMNDYAEKLGCVNSHFHNPHGLPDEEHWTCAYDLALISRKCMQNEVFRKITYTQIYILPATNMSEEPRHCSNHHQMRYAYRLPKFKYEYCIGGKTGYTDDAGYTLSTFARKDGVELICVVMGAGSPYTEEENQYTDTQKLFDTAFKNFSLVDMMSAGESANLPSFGRFNTLFYNFGDALTMSGESVICLPNDATLDQVETEMISYDWAEEAEGSSHVIGQIQYSLGDRVIGSSDILYTPSKASEQLPPEIETELTTRRTGEEGNAPVKEKERWHLKLPEIHLSDTAIAVLIGVGIVLLLVIALLIYRAAVILPRRRESSRRAHYRNAGGYERDKRKRRR